MSEKSVAIIVLNWNGYQDTIACIESLMDLAYSRFSIVICDNASSDNSVGHIKQWAAENLAAANDRRSHYDSVPFTFEHLSGGAADALSPREASRAAHTISLIETGANGGFAAGNNVGIRWAMAAGFDLYWVLNNDTEVKPDALGQLVDRLGEDPAIGICGSTLIYSGQRDLVQNWGGVHFNRLKGRGIGLGAFKSVSEPIDQAAVEARMDYVSGASMFVSKPFLEAVGLMQEDYFLYYEEIDWAARAKGRFKLGYASKSVVYHKVGASIGTDDFGNRSPLSDYYLSRSRIKFCSRFSKVSLPFVYFDITRRILRLAIAGNWARSQVLFGALVGRPYQKRP